jgi:phosphotransacetylase
MIEDAHSPEEKQNIIGSSAQEFVDKFMNSYLKKQIRKNLTPENAQRLMKRAATAWELLKREVDNEKT